MGSAFFLVSFMNWISGLPLLSKSTVDGIDLLRARKSQAASTPGMG